MKRFTVYFLIILAISFIFSKQPLLAEEPAETEVAATEEEEETVGVPFDPKETFGWTSIADSSAFILSSQTATPLAITIRIVNFALSLLGMASSAMILFGGVLYFSARDNEEQLKKAMEIIKGALIGLAIVLLSYSLAFMIYVMLASASREGWLVLG